jgi:hypothetical protein
VETHALLIGVDCYLENEMPNGGWYRCLGGCVRDVNQAEAFLRSKLGLAGDRIFKLTATYTGPHPASKKHSYQPTEPPEQWPTYQNMVAGFNRITELAQPGDQVYIHYSGHGGRATTAFPNLKTDGLDEALVPTDIGTSEARYVRDVEIAYLLKVMVDKGLLVTVVLDSCHSGGRGGAVARCAVSGPEQEEPIDTTLPPSDSLVAPLEKVASSWLDTHAGATRGFKPASGWQVEPQRYTLLAACGASESANEYPFDGIAANGALTYWMLDSLKQIGPGLTYKVLHDRILAKVHSQFVYQTPQLEGIGDRPVFGSDRVQLFYAVPVMDVTRDSVQLGAGQAQGLRKGAGFVIYPHGLADFTQVDQRLALVEISELGAVESCASITERLRDQAIEQGDQAVLLDPGDVKLRRAVYLIMGPGQTRDRIGGAIAELGGAFLLLAAEGESAEFQVNVNDRNEYEIWDSAGVAIPHLQPPIRVDEADAAQRVARRLVHMAKYRNVQELDNRDPMSPLARVLTVELMGFQKEYDPVDGPQPQPFTERGDTPALLEREWTFVRIHNNLLPNPDDPNDPSRILNITVLDLEPNWRITQILPYEAGYFEPLQPGTEIVLPLQAGELPAATTEATDVVKVFATRGTSNFRWLELPALDKPVELKSLRRGAPGALEQLLAAVIEDGPPPGTKRLKVYDSPSRQWVTAQVQVHVGKQSA